MSLSSSGQDFCKNNACIKNFSDDHKILVQRVQRMRQDLAQWRARAEVKTRKYTDQLTGLQDELLNSMEGLREDIEVIKSKVRGILDKHDPTWREKQSETWRGLAE